MLVCHHAQEYQHCFFVALLLLCLQALPMTRWLLRSRLLQRCWAV
jgi:hypothetical protein